MSTLLVSSLVGRLTDEPEVVEAFRQFGLEPQLIDDSTKAQSLASGIEVTLRTPWSIKLPQYAALEKKPRRRPYARAAVFDITLFNAETVVWVVGATRQEAMAPFLGPLPRDASWEDTPAKLVERLGPARFSTVDKETGVATWLRWDFVDEARFFMVDATPAGHLKSATIGLLIKK